MHAMVCVFINMHVYVYQLSGFHFRPSVNIIASMMYHRTISEVYSDVTNI